MLSILALAWHAYTFTISGSRITVEIRRGLRRGEAVSTYPDDAAAWQVDQIREQGFTEEVYAVKVNNKGRGETSVTDVAVAFSDGGSLGITRQDPPLPFRLNGEHAQTWYIPAPSVGAYVRTSMKAWPDKAKNMIVRGCVTLGNARRSFPRTACCPGKHDLVHLVEILSGRDCVTGGSRIGCLPGPRS